MKLKTPQHTQEARQAAEAPAVDLGPQKAAHALPDAFRAQAQAPPVRGLAAFMPVASGATAVPDYDQPTVDLGNDAPVRQIDTPAFRAWFGASEVVDEAGNPAVVHHGTNRNIRVFRPKGIGVHLGTPQQAQRAAVVKNGEKVLELYARIENPAHLKDFGDAFDSEDGEQFFGLVRAAKDLLDPDQRETLRRDKYRVTTLRDVVMLLEWAGHDGIVYDNTYEGDGQSWVVFNPDQIKSATNNCGAFDPSNPDITK